MLFAFGKNRGKVAATLVAALALLLRLHSLDWALPHTYEEATPLRIAFQMWGWDRGVDVHLNPDFFNYPSLILYIHFVVQGVLFGVLKLMGHIHAVADWQVLYLVNPTAIYLAERLVTVCFGVGTVLATVQLGRLVGGWPTGILAAAFLALNSFHIGQSQVIEVDVPLAFFSTLALWLIVRIAYDGAARNYVLAAIAIGLAVSSKYTGLFLAFPLVVAHVVRHRGLMPQRTLWMAFGIMTLVFAATSPFVVLDYKQFWTDLIYERGHMAEGHFGMSQSSSLVVYGRALFGRVVSIPLGLLAVAGIALTLRRRDRPAVVTFAFVVVYLAAVASWKMRADRYLLPVLPMLFVFAAAPLTTLFASLGKWRWLRRFSVVLVVLIIAAIDLVNRVKVVEALHYDARTEVANWMEANIPAGSFIVSEHYGPDLLTPSLLLQLEPPLRTRVLSESGSRPVYAMQRLPMTQTEPERSAPFYALALYPCADFVITSSAVRARYEREPERFREQLVFYAELESKAQMVKVFGSQARNGNRLTVYQLRVGVPQFSLGGSVPPPPTLPVDEMSVGRQSSFYYQLGTDYEYFGHHHEAYVCYVRSIERGALERATADRQLFMLCALGTVRTLLANGQGDTVPRVLDRVAELAPDSDTRQRVRDMARHVADLN